MVPSVHWGTGIPAGQGTVDSGIARRAAGSAGATTAGARANRRCPRLSGGQ